MRSFEGRQGYENQPNNTYYQNPQLLSPQSSNSSAFIYGSQYSPARNPYPVNSNQISEVNAMHTSPVLRSQDTELYYRSEPNQNPQNAYQRIDKSIYQSQEAARSDNFQYDNQNYYQPYQNYQEQYSPPKPLNRNQYSNQIPYKASASNLQSYSGQEKQTLSTNSRLNEHNDSFSGSNSSHNISVASSKKSKKPLVVMKIDIGEGQMDELVVFDGDDPLTTAQDFCSRNNLNPMIAEPLQKNINLQLMNYKKKREEREKQKQLSTQRHNGPKNNSQPSQLNTNSSMSINHSSKQNADRKTFNDNPIVVEKDYPAPGFSGLKRNASASNFEKQRARTPVKELPQSYQQYSLKGRSNSTKSLHNPSYHNPPSTGDTGDTEEFDNIDSGTSEEFRNAKQATFNRLYRDAVIKEQRQHQLKEVVQKEKNQKEMAEATFRPKINKSSVNMAEKRREFIDTKWQANTQIRSQVQDSRNKTPKRNLEISPIDWQQTASFQISSHSTKHSDECQENTFSIPVGGGPKSTKNSTTNKEVYSRLYHDAEKKDAKQLQAREAAKKEHSFKPAINKKSEKLIRTNLQFNAPDGNSSRNHIPKKPAQKERSVSAKRVEPDVDAKTGQKLFQPNINKQNKYYQLAKTKEDKALVEEVVELEEGTYERMMQKKLAATPKKSIKEPIIRSKKEASATALKSQAKEDKILRIIFNSLDADRDGTITADNVDISQLNTNVLEIISDILFSLEEQDVSYDFNAFKKIATKLGLVQKLTIILESELGLEAQGGDSQEGRSNDTNTSLSSAGTQNQKRYQEAKFEDYDNGNNVHETSFGDPSSTNLTKKYQNIAKKSFKSQH